MIARRSTRKIITRAIIFIIAGAIVNVAIAWGCALTLNPFDWPQGRYGTDATRNDDERWACYANHVHGAEVRMYAPDNDVFRYEIPGREAQLPTLQQWRAPWESEEELNDRFCTIFDARGWPMPCLWSKVETASGLPRRYGIVTQAVVLMRLNGVFLPRVLPTRPIWDRFAINTVLYAAILWLLFAAPGRIRRWRRVKRGLCPACAYPVGSSERCTECGAELAAQTRSDHAVGASRGA